MSCPNCFKGGIHDHAEPKGHMETLYDVPCYIASPPADSTKKSSILFICDAFGLKLVNNKLLADRYALESGCKVVVPDIIPGGGIDTGVMAHMDNMTATIAWTDVWGQLARVWGGLNAIAVMVPFLIRARPAKAYPDVLKFARAMRKDLPAGGKLGVCGFCWGGYCSTKLCTEARVEGGNEPLIDAQYCAHPSALEVPKMVVDAVTTYKVPYYMAIGDIDMGMSLKQVQATEAAVKEKAEASEGNEYVIKVYEGCLHGFAARAQPDNQVEIEAAEDTTKAAIAWWNKYLN